MSDIFQYLYKIPNHFLDELDNIFFDSQPCSFYFITYNYCIDQLRVAKKYVEYSLNYDFDLAEDNDAELAELEEQRLRKALQKIVPEEKSLLMMKYQDELSIKEIATTLGISESAVKMRLLRAKERLKKVYIESALFWGIIITKMLSVLFSNHD